MGGREAPARGPASGLPLAGKVVVNTRAPHQAGELSALLRSRGAGVLLYPCIDIAPPADPAPLDAALEAAAGGGFEWMLLTSANTVRVISERLGALGLNLPATGLQVAAVGPATAAAAEGLLLIPPLALPAEYSAEGLAAAVTARLRTAPHARPSRVLLAQADLARPALTSLLAAGGADVTAVAAYRTVQGSGGVDLARLLAGPESGASAAEGPPGPGGLPASRPDAVILASPSAALNLVGRLEAEGGSRAQLERLCLACVGRVTSDAARRLGLRVDVCPREHTLPALVQALGDHYRDTYLDRTEEP